MHRQIGQQAATFLPSDPEMHELIDSNATTRRQRHGRTHGGRKSSHANGKEGWRRSLKGRQGTECSRHARGACRCTGCPWRLATGSLCKQCHRARPKSPHGPVAAVPGRRRCRTRCPPAAQPGPPGRPSPHTRLRRRPVPKCGAAAGGQADLPAPRCTPSSLKRTGCTCPYLACRIGHSVAI
jgi:hypothetical protein